MAGQNQENNIIFGGPLDRILEGSTLGDLVLTSLSLHEDNPLQVDASTDEVLRANVLLDKAIRLAKWLNKKGIQIGDVISINSENRLEFAIFTCGALLAGATITCFNPQYTPGELKHVLNLSKPKLVFCSPVTVEKMLGIKHLYPFLEDIILFGKDKKSYKVIMLDDIVGDATGQDIDVSFTPPTLDPLEAVATILYSSGTTGLPKGVMCTHDNMTTYCDVMRVELPQAVFAEASDPFMGLPPFFHSMGFMTMFLNLLRGKLMVVISKFSVKVFLDSIIKYDIKRLVIPPPVLMAVLKSPLIDNYDLSAIEEIRTGAAPMGRELEKKLKSKFKVKYVVQSYGMTETTLGIIISRLDQVKIGSSGKIVVGSYGKIINEKGEALGPNQQGELCVKGPLIMKGYVGDPVATANTIDKDGWLHTGDIAYYDEEKFFFIVDRLKELIKYKAYQVAPAELEALLLTHPQVVDAAVIGLPDEEAGELPLAYVVKKPGSKITGKEIQQFVADNVSPQKRLRGGVIFTDEIPKNPTGKILRRVLKQQAIKLKSKL